MKLSGYIALTSAIIITILILVVVLSVSFVGFFTRFNVLEAYLKETSSALSEGCGQTALLKLGENINYAGNETITIDNNECNILPIENDDNNKIIKVKSSFGGTITNFKITINKNNFSLISWEELSSF